MLSKNQIISVVLFGVIGMTAGFLICAMISSLSDQYFDFRLYLRQPERFGLYLYTYGFGLIFALSYIVYALSRNTNRH